MNLPSILQKSLAVLLAIAPPAGLVRAVTFPPYSDSGRKTVGATTPPAEPSTFDKIWSLATLYKNKENPVIQEVSLMQDLFVQWAYGTSNQGRFDSGDLLSATRWGDADVRVWRPGIKIQLFDVFKLTGVIDANADGNPFYKDIYELSLVLAPNDAFNLGAGKQKGRFFTQEYSTPTRELLVFDQALLVNALVPRGVTGAWINGKTGQWIYALGGYAADAQQEFSRFNAGAVVQGDLGYDFAKKLNVEKAIVRFDYQGSTSADNGFGPGKFSNAFSLNTTFEKGRFYAYTDLLGGIGRGSQGDVWGVILAPTWFLIPKTLQLVLRYQYAHGNDNGLKLGRYEIFAPGILDTKGAGSDYNAAYLGLNYFVYGHKFKFMTGVEYNDLTGGKKDFSGWTYLAGVRLAF